MVIDDRRVSMMLYMSLPEGRISVTPNAFMCLDTAKILVGDRPCYVILTLYHGVEVFQWWTPFWTPGQPWP